ncbi:MAG: hypothetical protein EHM13_13985 [Acidobacteria bacterium]|nr:MAG: hypothetical protein EHM13_13985 [Acidobacteriota bacterium]
MNRRVVGLAVTALAASLAPSSAEIVDKVLAIVGPRVITLSDARAAITFGVLRPTAGADPIAEATVYLVNRQLMLGEVDRYAAPPPAPALLQKRLDAMRGRFSAAELLAALEATAMTEARLTDLVADTIRIESYLDQRFNAAAQPTADEVQRFYRDHTADFSVGGRVLPFEEVRPQVQSRLMSERRSALIAEWLDRLRRRTPVAIR